MWLLLVSIKTKEKNKNIFHFPSFLFSFSVKELFAADCTFISSEAQCRFLQMSSFIFISNYSLQ